MNSKSNPITFLKHKFRKKKNNPKINGFYIKKKYLNLSIQTQIEKCVFISII